jgi:8-hydroxy-5-deazaflavin:NADPH oxidoreductase
MQVGILGGTGPAGRGLAIRLSLSGHEVLMGSRDPDRAALVASELVERSKLSYPMSQSSPTGSVLGVINEMAADAEIVVVATPWEGAVATASLFSRAMAGKVVISMVNALQKEGREMLALIPSRGSIAATIQAALTDSKVAAAMHHLPAAKMEDLSSGLAADVLVCSDFPEATEVTMGLIESIKGLRPLDAGSLAQAAAIEAFTAVCITLNIRYRSHSTIQMAGIKQGAIK